MQPSKEIEIRINPNGMIVNSDARTGVRKSDNDTITFRALGSGGPWRIVFLSTSPFASSTFIVPQSGTVNSGPITATYRGTPIKFRYEVQNADGIVVDDPDVVVEG